MSNIHKAKMNYYAYSSIHQSMAYINNNWFINSNIFKLGDIFPILKIIEIHKKLDKLRNPFTIKVLRNTANEYKLG